jgi:D-alanyl-D-alanine carboxypeptidase (penicillin-binding protein 5/6)
MNQRANELGCENTHFANPHGFHDANHYTTAQDLAAITREAMKNETFRKIVSTLQYTMAATAKRDKLVIESKVELINPESKYYYEGCIGIKTGYHSQAGQCLVGAAEMGGRTLIAVALHSTVDYADRKWYDTARMFEYGFTRFDTYTIKDLFSMAGDGINSIQVEDAAADDIYAGKLALILSQTSDDGYSFMALKDSDEADQALQYFMEHASVTATTDYLEKLAQRETIEAGSIVGTLSFTAATGETITGTLIADRSVELAPLRVSAWDYLAERMPWIETLRDERVIYAVIGTVVLILFLIILSAIRSVRRNRRRKRIYEKRRRAYYERVRSQSVDPYDRPAQPRPAQKKRPRYDDF